MHSRIYDIARNPTGLGDILGERDITHVFICGLALDYCVGCTACDVAELGFRAFVLDDLCRSVSPKSEAEMRASFAASVRCPPCVALDLFNTCLTDVTG